VASLDVRSRAEARTSPEDEVELSFAASAMARVQDDALVSRLGVRLARSARSRDGDLLSWALMGHAWRRGIRVWSTSPSSAIRWPR
jgi:hypothetical protein